MSGKPAARQGDMTQYGGPIVQGSAGVRIGAPTGVACSVCPGGMTSGNPVNPLLGAKVQPGETDLALPGPLPFILSRTYSSYRTKTPAPVGVFGPGWKAPSDIRLQIRDDALILNDNGGRSIHFEPLLPGEAVYSRSESMWLVRGGKAAQPDGHTLARLWASLPPDIRLSPHLYLATNSAQGPWWILGWSERVPGAEDVLPAPLPPYRVLTGMADRFGRTLAYRREAAGDLAGEITGVTDGAGREFRLVLTTQAQRAEEARTSSLSSSDSSRPLSASAFPDTLPGTEYGPDRGIRLSAVWLMHDPAYPESLPAAPLVRYTYTEAGELLAVYDRSNTQVRAFTYDAQHPGRMVAHRYAGRPEMRYRYDDTGRVVEQLNPAGLSYRYQYEQDRITVTDSLNRREVLHTEGGAGLKRVVKKELADGSVTHSGYDAAGRLTAQTDAAGRRTEYGLNVVSGDITDITTPDGRETKFYYNDGNQLTAVVYPDGLESRREYDEPGRLVSETSRSGETVRYRYDDAHSELPATTTDATGSTRQMTWSRYGQLLAFTDCSGYQTRYEYDRFGQMTAVHREEGISLYRHYDNRGRLTSVKDAQGRETQYEYNAAGDLTAVITPDGNRSETQYDAWGKAVSTTQGGLTRSMEYDAAGRVISLTNENGSHSDFSYDALDRLVQQGGFDGRTQRYHYDLTGKLTQSEDEGLVTLWYYDESDRITHRTVNGEPAEQWQYDDHGWLTDISHLSEGHRVAVHYGYDDKGRLTGERQTVENPETGELLWQHETTHAYNEQGLANRVTPFTGPDLRNLSDGAKVVTKYLSKGTMILVVAALVALLAFFVWVWIKGPKFQGKIRWYLNVPLIALVIVLFTGATNLALAKRVLSSYFVNIAFAYQDYGYPYCLAVTLFDTGISEPNGYSEQLVKQIETSEGEQKEDDTVKPNIIFLQLESFFDPELVNFLNISEDPIPYYRQLMKDYSSGYLRVPVVGAGTANTEFETISGMSLRYFGAGEYPYKSVLSEETCESAPYVLKNLGYATHAIHNNEANFYSRRSVFSRLGFDTFTSEEYMPDISDVTATGWVKDHILTKEIIKTLDATDEPDYIYTISVQGHGDYPTEPVLDDPEITVTGAEDREKNNYSWEYYVNQIHEMDIFVKELTTKLADYPEPVVLVMYGDHLPTMGLKVEDLENRYLYQTEYVIWDNMGLKRKQENIASYQIAAEVMNRVGIHDGTIFRYHQTRRNTKNYQVDLEVLQYDMLYGKRYVYGEDGETPYERVKLQMGALPVTLERIEKSGEDTWYFYGENFTASSRVEVNEEIQDTVYVSPSILMVHSLTLEDGDQITIAQQSNSSTKKVLTRTEPMMYEEPKTVSTPTSTPNPDSTKTDVTQENANTSTAPQDELTAAPSGAPEGEGDKIEPSKTENSDKPAEDGGLQN